MDQDEQESHAPSSGLVQTTPWSVTRASCGIGKQGAVGLLQGSISFQGGENRKTIAEGFWEPAVRSWGRRGAGSRSHRSRPDPVGTVLRVWLNLQTWG